MPFNKQAVLDSLVLPVHEVTIDGVVWLLRELSAQALTDIQMSCTRQIKGKGKKATVEADYGKLGIAQSRQIAESVVDEKGKTFLTAEMVGKRMSKHVAEKVMEHIKEFNDLDDTDEGEEGKN